MKLVVGLGNPGARYAGSPHNAGFRVVERLAERHAGSGRAVWTGRLAGELSMLTLDAHRLVLLKPLTYMNRSGHSVRQALQFFEIPVDGALVVHDELDLPRGSVRLKLGGGEAGHNGLRSVSEELGTRDYARLRVGVGRPAQGEVRDWLLAPMASGDAAELERSLDEAGDAIELWARSGLEQAMNRVNRRAEGTKARAEGQPE